METKNASFAFEGKNYKVFTLEAFGRTFDVIVVPATYLSGTLAVRLFDIVNNDDTGGRDELEPFAVMTVNVPGFSLQATKLYDANTAFVKDYSENSWVPAFLEKNGLAEKTDFYVENGYVTLFAWKFNTDRFFAGTQE